MNETQSTVSEVSELLSDISSSCGNVIDDSELYSEENNSHIGTGTDKSNSKNNTRQKCEHKPAVLGADEENVGLNSDSASDDDLEASDCSPDQETRNKSSFKENSKYRDGQSRNSESDSDIQSGFPKSRLKRMQVISSDSSDTESIENHSRRKSYNNNKYSAEMVDSGTANKDERALSNISSKLFNCSIKSRNDSIKEKDDSNKTKTSNDDTDSDLDSSFTKARLKGNQVISSESSDGDQNNEKIYQDQKYSRLSEEFRLTKGKNILHSTLIESQSATSTPLNKATGKRLLNKSIETPRTIKQIKESQTPRNVEQILSNSKSSDVQGCKSDDDIIDISSDEENVPKTPVRPKKQSTLDALVVKNQPLIRKEIKNEPLSTNVEVSQREYELQQSKVRAVESDILKAKNLLRTVNLEYLPDKGKSVHARHVALEGLLLEEVKKLSNMKVVKQNSMADKIASSGIPQVKMLSWEEIEAKAGNVQPRTFGKQAMFTYNAQKAVTMDRLQQLHISLKGCPSEKDLAEDPKGLKVELMIHQRRALAWLMWREKQKPSGGILADDMGLGKTLTMIALMLKINEIEKNEESSSEEESDEEKEKRSKKYPGGTLVVCPASLINQWSGELEKRTKRGLASYEMYHGAKRETQPRKLAQHDMVITTYAIVNNECEKNGAIFRVKWRRIVIDEAHQIRNHKSQTSEAMCKLAAKSRWALTGTPVHNKELDMYALLKFIRCTPFDDLQVWKRWVGDKSTGGTERLHTVISSLLLRRTKVELIEKGFLDAMPERRWELIPIELNKSERDVYNKILIFSRTLFAQFLHQRAEKNQDAIDNQYASLNQQPNELNREYVVMRQKLLRLNKLKDIKQHEILVLLLRLRQICCHPSLITGMLHEDMAILGEDDGGNDKGEALDLLEQLNKLTLQEDEYSPNANVSSEGVGDEALGLKEAARGVLNVTDPIFSETTKSSKIKELVRVLKDKVLTKDDKAIIVSQWSSFLRLISHHLKDERISFDQLDGSVPVHKRMDMVDRFNNPKDQMRVLLLSLTAGGVGLNLVGANHLFLLDLHWNPQLENQAQDRIYRLGQQKEVWVYKFMATDTIEKRILDLQEKKLEIAKSMLTGTKQALTSKLSLQDLKMLFEM